MDEIGVRANPTMLMVLRESRGLTQVELARLMSSLADVPVSQGYVSKAESSRADVSGDRLELYARALRYPPELLARDPNVHGVGVGLVHHRKRASLGAPVLRRIHAELGLARMQTRVLVAEAAVTPEHNFRRVHVEVSKPPERIAVAVRKAWAVPAGPIPDLVKLIEDVGGLVLARDLGSRELDAVTQWAGAEPPLFLLNREAPADRFRFSLAHELGHTVMHPEPGSTTAQEKEADTFAGAFLMPASDIRDDLRGPVTIGRLLDLKQRWGVSMAALAKRALSLAVLSDWQYRNLMVEMSALGYRTQEPGSVCKNEPRRITKIVDQLLTGGSHDEDQLAVLTGLLPEEFRMLYTTSHASRRGDS